MERSYQYDIVVVGGGTAGVAAAVGAAKAGAKTLLVERNAYLGGEAANSGVNCFCGFYTCGSDPVRVVKGIGQLVLDEMRALGPTIAEEISESGNWILSSAGVSEMCTGQPVGEGACGLFFTYGADWCRDCGEMRSGRFSVRMMRACLPFRQRHSWMQPETQICPDFVGAKLIWGTDGGHP